MSILENIADVIDSIDPWHKVVKSASKFAMKSIWVQQRVDQIYGAVSRKLPRELDRNHDLLRTALHAYADTMQQWCHEIKSGLTAASGGREKETMQRFLEALEPSLAQIRARAINPGEANGDKLPPEIIEELLVLLPEASRPNEDAALPARIDRLSFEMVRHAISITGWDLPEVPNRIRNHVFAVEPDAAKSIGYQLLMEFLRGLKSDRPEAKRAWRAYQIHAMQCLSDEIEALGQELAQEFDDLKKELLLQRSLLNRIGSWTTSDEVKGIINARFHDLAKGPAPREKAIADINAIAEQILGDGGGLLLVGGDGGVGKSAVLAKWLGSQRQAGKAIVAYAFIQAERLTVDPERAETEIAHAILSLTAPSEGGAGITGVPRNDLGAALNQDRTEPLIILIDGLDEASLPLEPFKPLTADKKVLIVVSARDDGPGRPSRYLEQWERRFNPQSDSAQKRVRRYDVRPLDLEETANWVASVRPGPANGGGDIEKLAKEIHLASGGLPLIIGLILEEAKRRNRIPTVGQRKPDDPVNAFIIGEINRLRSDRGRFIDDDAERILGALAMARSALPLAELARLSGVARHPESLVWAPRRLLTISDRQGQSEVAVFHPRFADGFRVALVGAVATLEERLFDNYKQWAQRNEPYFLQFLCQHLAEAGYPEAAIALLLDGDFTRRRYKHLGDGLWPILRADLDTLTPFANGDERRKFAVMALAIDMQTELRRTMSGDVVGMESWNRLGLSLVGWIFPDCTESTIAFRPLSPSELIATPFAKKRRSVLGGSTIRSLADGRCLILEGGRLTLLDLADGQLNEEGDVFSDWPSDMVLIDAQPTIGGDIIALAANSDKSKQTKGTTAIYRLVVSRRHISPVLKPEDSFLGNEEQRFPLDGMLVLRNGDILIWRSRTPLILVARDGQWARKRPEPLAEQIIGALQRKDGRLLIWDSRNFWLLEADGSPAFIGPDKTPRAEEPDPDSPLATLGSSIEAVVKLDNGDVIAIESSNLSVTRLKLDGTVSFAGTLFGIDNGIAAVRATSCGNRVLACSPHVVDAMVVDESGTRWLGVPIKGLERAFPVSEDEVVLSIPRLGVIRINLQSGGVAMVLRDKDHRGILYADRNGIVSLCSSETAEGSKTWLSWQEASGASPQGGTHLVKAAPPLLPWGDGFVALAGIDPSDWYRIPENLPYGTASMPIALFIPEDPVAGPIEVFHEHRPRGMTAVGDDILIEDETGAFFWLSGKTRSAPVLKPASPQAGPFPEKPSVGIDAPYEGRLWAIEEVPADGVLETHGRRLLDIGHALDKGKRSVAVLDVDGRKLRTFPAGASANRLFVKGLCPLGKENVLVWTAQQTLHLLDRHGSEKAAMVAPGAIDAAAIRPDGAQWRVCILCNGLPLQFRLDGIRGY